MSATRRSAPVTWLGFVVRNIRRRPGRALFTVMGIAFAVGSFLALTGLTNGLVASAGASHEERGVDLVVMRRGMIEVFGGSLPAGLGPTIESLDGVADVAAELVTSLQMGVDTQAAVAGWNLDEFNFGGMLLVRGRLPMPGQSEVVLGEALAEALGADIDSEITLSFLPHRVSGIADYDNGLLRGMAFMPMSDLQDLLSRQDQVTLFQVRLAMPGDLAERERIQAEIGALRPDISATTTAEVLRSARIISLIEATSLAISLVAVAIGCLSVLNTMAMAVEERTRDIGVLRAIGWSRQRILALILSEGFFLAGAGGLAGIVLGWAGHRILVETMAPGAGLPLPAMLGEALNAMALALIVGALGAAVPAWRASRLPPALALRRQ